MLQSLALPPVPLPVAPSRVSLVCLKAQPPHPHELGTFARLPCAVVQSSDVLLLAASAPLRSSAELWWAPDSLSQSLDIPRLAPDAQPAPPLWARSPPVVIPRCPPAQPSVPSAFSRFFRLLHQGRPVGLALLLKGSFSRHLRSFSFVPAARICCSPHVLPSYGKTATSICIGLGPIFAGLDGRRRSSACRCHFPSLLCVPTTPQLCSSFLL